MFTSILCLKYNKLFVFLDSIDVQFTKAPFDNMHMFTGCDPCTAGSAANTDCSIDVTVLPSSGDIGNTIVVCLLVSRAVYVYVNFNLMPVKLSDHHQKYLVVVVFRV